MITENQVQEARALLAKYLPETRLLPSRSFHSPNKGQLFLKLETELPTDCFKVRGAIYALSVNIKRNRVTEVVAASTGNHGAAVAYAAHLFNVRATIFLPAHANPIKRARIQEYGARVVEAGNDLGEASPRAREYARHANAYFLDDATDPDLPCGPAVIGCEILDALPDVGSIWVPVGDTALIRGVAFAAKSRRRTIRVIGVQSEKAPSYYLSWKSGKAVPTDSCSTIADGLATRSPVLQNVKVIRALVDEMVLVSEDHLLGAIRLLHSEEGVLAEPAGAAAVAGFIRANQHNAVSTVALVTGASIPLEVLTAALNSRSIGPSAPKRSMIQA